MNKLFASPCLLKEILYFHSCNGFTEMVLKDKSQEVLDLPLVKIEIMLPEGMFCRVHRSFLVNSGEIIAFRYYRNQLLAIAQGCRLPVSRRRGKIIMESLCKSPESVSGAGQGKKVSGC